MSLVAAESLLFFSMVSCLSEYCFSSRVVPLRWQALFSLQRDSHGTLQDLGIPWIALREHSLLWLLFTCCSVGHCCWDEFPCACPAACPCHLGLMACFPLAPVQSRHRLPVAVGCL